MFGRKKEEEPVVVAVAKEEPQAFVPAGVTKIGPGITMIGDFEGKDPIELNGTILGNILSSSSLNVSETGKLKGNGQINSLHSSGVINGTIECMTNTHLTATGILDGNLKTQTLKTDDGSEITGTLNLRKEDSSCSTM